MKFCSVFTQSPLIGGVQIMTFFLANDVQEGDKVYNNVQKCCRRVQIHMTSSYEFFYLFSIIYILLISILGHATVQVFRPIPFR